MYLFSRQKGQPLCSRSLSLKAAIVTNFYGFQGHRMKPPILASPDEMMMLSYLR